MWQGVRLFADSYDDPGLFEALGPKFGSDIYFVTHTWMGPEAHPDMGSFIEAYKAYHGSPPDTSFVATGWDTIMLMAQAAEKAGSFDGAAIAKALENNEYNLLTGKLSYRPAKEGHAPDKAAVLISLMGMVLPLPRAIIRAAVECMFMYVCLYFC